jgi:hypothetical protein
MNVFTAPAAPPAPFTAIVTVYRSRTDGEGGFVTETIDQIDVEAYDVRSAWLAGQNEIERAFDGEASIDAYISGVVGPRGWEARPEWIPEWSVMNVAQRDAHQMAALEAHFAAA